MHQEGIETDTVALQIWGRMQYSAVGDETEKMWI